MIEALVMGVVYGLIAFVGGLCCGVVLSWVLVRGKLRDAARLDFLLSPESNSYLSVVTDALPDGAEVRTREDIDKARGAAKRAR